MLTKLINDLKENLEPLIFMVSPPPPINNNHFCTEVIYTI